MSVISFWYDFKILHFDGLKGWRGRNRESSLHIQNELGIQIEGESREGHHEFSDYSHLTSCETIIGHRSNPQSNLFHNAHPSKIVLLPLQVHVRCASSSNTHLLAKRVDSFHSF